MVKPKVPVLITSSAIAHDTSVNLSRLEDRLNYTLESIAKWLEISPDTQFVICDGSGYDFSHLVRARFPEAIAEFLHFNNDVNQVQLHGRGYGEGEIVKFAIQNSRYISEAECFAKCTAKLWVSNYLECLKYWNGSLLMKGVFKNAFTPWKKTEFTYIDTRFYICSTATYRRLFEEAHHKINVARGHGLEECFREELIKNKVSNYLMTNPPVIFGMGGGTGVQYKNTLIRRHKEKLRYQIVKHNREFRLLFVEQLCTS